MELSSTDYLLRLLFLSNKFQITKFQTGKNLFLTGLFYLCKYTYKT